MGKTYVYEIGVAQAVKTAEACVIIHQLLEARKVKFRNIYVVLLLPFVGNYCTTVKRHHARRLVEAVRLPSGYVIAIQVISNNDHNPISSSRCPVVFFFLLFLPCQFILCATHNEC